MDGWRVSKAVVYLAGPINGCTDRQANEWRAIAKNLLADFADVSDPMERDYRGSEEDNAQRIVDDDLRAIAYCNAIMVNPWRPSVGTAMETIYAYRELRRHVVVVRHDGLSPWFVANSHHVADSLPDAIAYLREHFRRTPCPS